MKNKLKDSEKYRYSCKRLCYRRKKGVEAKDGKRKIRINTTAKFSEINFLKVMKRIIPEPSQILELIRIYKKSFLPKVVIIEAYNAPIGRVLKNKRP